MNLSAVTNAITIIPAIPIDRLTWDNEHKSLTIDIAGNLAYGTTYTITIGTTATDVNGKPIDGNDDRVAGDPFLLHFSTRAVDNAGPVVISSNPDFNLPADNFDVDDVINIVFDELINPQTVNDTTLVLTQNGEKIKTQTMVTAVSDRSVINLKAYEPLIPDTEYSLLLCSTVTDTVGNQMLSDCQELFHTSIERYSETKSIDDFTFTGYWEQPGYSGSTSGINVANTTFGYSKDIYLPGSASAPVYKRSAFITYQWLDTPPDGGYLLREYLASGAPKDVTFDNSYILQCYVFGDGSYNKFPNG